MKNKLFSILFIVAFSLCASQVKADGVLLSWSPRSIEGVTEEAFNEAKKMSVEQIAQKNLAARSWADAYLLMVAVASRKNDRSLPVALAAQLNDGTVAKLQNTSQLIIWERITSGEITFEGKGYQVNDDLFSVAGRANWMLRTLTRKNFGYVKPSSSAAELTALQQKWQRYSGGEEQEEYKNPYPTTEKGLEEIRSREALEALIIALKPDEAKDRITKDCLQKNYKIDKLPSDPVSSAMMCSPDTLTPRYLIVLTDVPEQHDYEWWKTWWEQNQNKLEWQPERGKFIVKN